MRRIGITFAIVMLSFATALANEVDDIKAIITKVNNHWQQNNSPKERAFWDVAAYHTGNMEVYKLMPNQEWLNYSLAWAEHNQWKGAKSDNRQEWRYDYGENDKHVLFGDWQICFQTYCDLYEIAPAPEKIARAQEVMEHEMTTNQNDYWWWADGLYMVMPVMTKLYKITGSKLYLEKLYEYLSYAESIMLDDETGLLYRDAKYVFPKHKSHNGKKDFWSRGDGWVLAGLAKVLQDLPKDDAHRDHYISLYKKMAKSIIACQQKEGYWTRSLLDPEHAPGYETRGTAFYGYALQWGVNNGFFTEKAYQKAADKAWKYLSTVALQEDGSVGYVQPIGEKAIPGQVVDTHSTANFGVGAFLLAACERAKSFK